MSHISFRPLPFSNLHSKNQERSIDQGIAVVFFLSIILAIATGVLFGAPKESLAATAAPINLPFSYDFSKNGILDETKNQGDSSSPYFWLNSGGQLPIQGGTGHSLSGTLPSTHKWFAPYAATYPVTSDSGTHPQNLFSLFVRKSVKDVSLQVYVKLNKDNLTNSSNRQVYNGESLILRYVDENNYYYAGLRADGYAVIKKKSGGVFTTLAYEKVLPGTYNFSSAPNLIPKLEWIGLRASILDTQSGPKISIFTDRGKTGKWTLAAEAVDNPLVYGVSILSAGLVGIRSDFADVELDDLKLASSTVPITPPVPTLPTPIPYGLSLDRNVIEVGSFSESADSNWWVNSGAGFNVANAVGQTVHGDLPLTNPWRTLYAVANPVDTDLGLHPQNIFRLVTKSTWQDFIQQGYFKVDKDNFSQSPNRDGHNGILFFNRYVDGNNLYYTGLRVDGSVIIKKKKGGVYSTLLQKPIYAGTYNRSSNPNLLPHNEWLGLRSIVKTLSNGSVQIDVYTDEGKTGVWKSVASVVDSVSPITAKASAGIRTDFMDVSLSDYAVVELP